MRFLFFPQQCPICGKASVASLPAHSAQSALSEEQPIELKCPFDATRWKASANERRRLATFVDENTRLEQVSWLRFENLAPS